MDRLRVLHGGPWSFDGSLLILEVWNDVGEISQLAFQHTKFWVQIHNIPMLCMTKEIGRFLGNQIGEVREIDDGASGDCMGKFIRVRVLVDIAKLLQRFLKVNMGRAGKEVIMLLSPVKSRMVCPKREAEPSQTDTSRGHGENCETAGRVNVGAGRGSRDPTGVQGGGTGIPLQGNSGVYGGALVREGIELEGVPISGVGKAVEEVAPKHLLKDATVMGGESTLHREIHYGEAACGGVGGGYGSGGPVAPFSSRVGLVLVAVDGKSGLAVANGRRWKQKARKKAGRDSSMASDEVGFKRQIEGAWSKVQLGHLKREIFKKKSELQMLTRGGVIESWRQVLAVENDLDALLAKDEMNGIWENDRRGIEGIVIDYFADLFSSSSPLESSIAVVTDVVGQRLSIPSKRHLEWIFVADEVCHALFQMAPSKSSGPDGFNAGFYQKFWAVRDQFALLCVLVWRVWFRRNRAVHAVLHGVRLSLHSGLSPLLVESNALGVINVLKEGSVPCSDLGLVVSDIFDICRSLSVFSFSFVPRYVNKVGDALAKAALSFFF
ncbi:hypothetical protein ACOSQ3_028990 [Xanthoceras sorbifolium]